MVAGWQAIGVLRGPRWQCLGRRPFVPGRRHHWRPAGTTPLRGSSFRSLALRITVGFTAVATASFAAYFAAVLDWLTCENDTSEACDRANLAQLQLRVAVVGFCPHFRLRHRLDRRLATRRDGDGRPGGRDVPDLGRCSRMLRFTVGTTLSSFRSDRVRREHGHGSLSPRGVAYVEAELLPRLAAWGRVMSIFRIA